jgi:hypothetical protein
MIRLFEALLDVVTHLDCLLAYLAVTNSMARHKHQIT